MRKILPGLTLAALTATGQTTAPKNSSEVSLSHLVERLAGAGLDPNKAQAIEKDLANHLYTRVEDQLLVLLPAENHPQGLLETLGETYFLDGKYAQAAIAYKKAEKYGAIPESAHFKLAMSFVELKRTSWARDELSRLEGANPKQPLYPYWLGRLDYDAQKFAQAELHFRKALEIDPRFARGYDSLGLCEEANGDLAGAEQNFRRANELNREQGSRSAWPALDYGSLLAKSSRFAEAKMLLDEAIGIDQSLAKAYYERGRVEEQTANPGRAEADFKAASTLDSSDPSPVYALFRMYKAAGREELAAATMARFKALKTRAENGSRTDIR